jgi:hypothetical protein
LNPFRQIGVSSVDVVVDPANVSMSCDVDVVATIRCQEVNASRFF